MTLRQKAVEAIRSKIDPSQDGLLREAYEIAKRAIEDLPQGTFSDEAAS